MTSSYIIIIIMFIHFPHHIAINCYGPFSDKTLGINPQNNCLIGVVLKGKSNQEPPKKWGKPMGKLVESFPRSAGIWTLSARLAFRRGAQGLSAISAKQTT